MSFLDNGEEGRSLFLGELVVASKLQRVVVQVEQYGARVVVEVVVDLENASQLPATSASFVIFNNRMVLVSAHTSVTAARHS